MFKVIVLWLSLFLVCAPTSGGDRGTHCATSTCVSPPGVLGLSPPERVLIVPLLHIDEESVGSARWAEAPAAQVAKFYRSVYRSQVELLHDIRIWPNYFQQIERLTQGSSTFDRVVFIGHGGFDGPILDETVLRSGLVVVAGVGTLSRSVEQQPGLADAVTITYDVSGNRAFSDFVAGHWQDMLKTDADPEREAQELEVRLQPLRPDCISRCMPAALGDSVRVAACEWVCRDPLYTSTSGEELAPERFLLFATGLRKVVAERGMIVIESCNQGTVAIKGTHPWNTDGLLVHSTLAGGPHPTYVHLLASATGRAVAGPIGKISADRMEAFVAMLESNRSPRQLRLIVPIAQTPAQ